MMTCDIPYSWKKPLCVVWITVQIFILVVPLGLSNELVNCKFEYQSQFFDFNGLSLTHWNVSDIHDANLSYILFSVCNKTYLKPCGMFSFCVVMKDSSKWSSSKSDLYVQGDMGNEDIRLSTVLRRMDSSSSGELKLELRFKCSSEIGVPKFEAFKSDQLVVEWETVAACSVNNLNKYKNCIFKSEVMGEFNFQPLRQLLYYNTTNSRGSRFYVNVCGGTVGTSVCGNVSDIAICMVDSENKAHILGYASRERFNRIDLRLEYGSKKKHVKIELLCNAGLLLGKLKLKDESKSLLSFDLETPLACVNKLLNCFVQDKNHFSYNLHSLSVKDYEIYDQSKHKYVISVCRSVKNSYCSGGVSMCLVNGSSSINLGTLKEGLHYEDSQLSISAAAGDYCNVSNLRYKSVILFECAKTDSLPSFVNIDEEKCVYTFLFQTTYACPFMFVEGENCRVRDEDYGNDFDFKSLRKPMEDYIINYSDGQFHLNLCGDLLKPCNGSTNVGVCFTDRKGTEHAIGEVAMSPRYKDGHLSFVLKGELCKSNNTPTEVNIIFRCNHQLNAERSHPKFVEKNNECSYSFVWYTAIACAQYTTHECKVEDDSGEVYDLSPLSLHDDDYVVWLNDKKGYWKFVINVCQPIMFGNRARCSSETAICMQNMSEPNYPKSFSSLGQASSLQYDKVKKVLKVDYSGGSTCPNGRGGGGGIFNSLDLHSTIIFICDKESSPYPKLTKQNGCYYEFEWRTKFACSKKIEPIHEDNNCKAYNSFSGVRVDLTSFAGHEHLIKHPSGRQFRFVICGSLNNESSDGVGICEEKENGCENIGIGNSNLYFDRGKFYLNYTDGANCASNVKIFTIIEFICGTKDSQLITFLNPCAYSVSVFTSLACSVPCETVADSPKKINLSFLSNYQNSYKTTANGVDYFISVCKPLFPKVGTCDIGSAVCKAVAQEESRSEEVSLGSPHFRPASFGDHVILNYSSNQCSNNPSKNVGSSIIFMCNPSLGIGAPVLSQILNSDCHYEFIWNTSIVCDDDLVKLTDAVSVRMLNNSQNNVYIDLQPLCEIGKYEVENFVISMCNQNSLCDVQKVDAHKNISYGRAEYAVFTYSENKTKLFMTNGDDCEASPDKYRSTLHLICSPNAIEDLHVLKETECNVEFVWKSSSACEYAAVIRPTAVEASKSSAGTIGVTLGIGFAVIACLIVFCLRKTTHTNWCRRNINRYFHRRHEGEFHYTLRNPDSYDFEISSEELLFYVPCAEMFIHCLLINFFLVLKILIKKKKKKTYNLCNYALIKLVCLLGSIHSKYKYAAIMCAELMFQKELKIIIFFDIFSADKLVCS
ncbi:Uncharacterized protein GBIM_18194 [Gryllus bimaculatus]|nr:Uncharacterized protein GBIM_18194 [Gryllus bimaculatus]